jgi:putative nucleotidyltransferase with HDIG domain
VNGKIRLRAIDAENTSQTWDSDSKLRIGRLETLEIVANDSSVSRHHAEIYATPRGWRVRDLQSTNGTFLNGTRLGPSDWPIRLHDIIKCGNVTFVVDALGGSEVGRETIAVDTDELVVEASQASSWEDAFQGLAYDRNRSPRPGEQLLVLLRAGHHLGHIETEEALLHSILNDAVGALDAQRGAIVLAEESEGEGPSLKLRALATGTGEIASRTSFSQSLAQRCFTRGESIVCRNIEEDPELMKAKSIAEGAMSSVLCVLLRTPRKRLGVLHLDRGPFQKPFGKDDLYLADALAANVSAGIESAQLLRNQRELFINTITILAQAIDLRDDYTGGHTARVTRYSELLARQLKLPPSELKWIRMGTPLHDIGKIGINDAILLKPDKLTDEEFAKMKLHTVKGAAILSNVRELNRILPIVRSHHERWDGKGYPDGLAGEVIHRYARIVAVCDTFDAMTSDRPYRKGLPSEVAFAEIEKQSGLQFDPECAAAFLTIKEQIVEVMGTSFAQIRNLSDSVEMSISF